MKYDFALFYECVKQTLVKRLLFKRRHNVYPGSMKQNRTFRLKEATGLSLEKIHHHILQFVYGTRNLWRQDQCWMQWEVLHPQKFAAACFLQTLFVWACHWAEFSVIFALCWHTIVALLCRILRTVVSGNSNSLATLRMDFIGEQLNACLTLSIFSACVLDRPLPLHPTLTLSP